MSDPRSRKPTSLSAHGFRIQSMMEDEGGAEAPAAAAPPGPEAGADWVSLNNLSGEAAPVSGDGLATAADLAPPPSASAPPPPPGVQDRVVHALHRKGTVTLEQVEQAVQVKRQQGMRDPLWRVLAELKDVDRNAVYAQAALTYAFRVAPIRERPPDSDFVRTVMESLPDANRDALIRLNAAPYAYAQEQATGLLKIVFITDDPMRQELQRAMNALELERFELCYAPREVVSGVLREAFPRKNEYLERVHEHADDAFDIGVSFESGERSLIDEDALEAEISRSSLINLVEAALVESVRLGASDIHIYPNAQRKVEIHFRVDGRLRHWHTEERGHPEALLAVVKDNALNVDRFERDTAQDGFIQRWIDDTLIRYRVSVLPIANANPDIRAESIVIRVLDDRKVMTDLSKLGLLPFAQEQFNKAIRQPNGMVILTGPTGSGKSTTLVAALSQVVTPDVNVLTVEDPVEYIIPGVRQIKLSHKLSLEGALRAILRHDPDVVMVGEMRDKDTAELGVKLANTGHLTFSTLHTNDAPSAVSRLYKMGLEPFLIAYAINLVVAQRLIRTLCSQCKKAVPQEELDRTLLSHLGFTEDEISEHEFFRANPGSGCATCKGQGFKGRRAIAEALYFSPAIRKLIVEAGGTIDEDGLSAKAQEEGMLTLQASARELVKMGETSVDEVLRVTASE
jgi:type IV pilus assembly protein PilB